MVLDWGEDEARMLEEERRLNKKIKMEEERHIKHNIN